VPASFWPFTRAATETDVAEPAYRRYYGPPCRFLPYRATHAHSLHKAAHCLPRARFIFSRVAPLYAHDARTDLQDCARQTRAIGPRARNLRNRVAACGRIAARVKAYTRARARARARNPRPDARFSRCTATPPLSLSLSPSPASQRSTRPARSFDNEARRRISSFSIKRLYNNYVTQQARFQADQWGFSLIKSRLRRERWRQRQCDNQKAGCPWRRFRGSRRRKKAGKKPNEEEEIGRQRVRARSRCRSRNCRLQHRALLIASTQTPMRLRAAARERRGRSIRFLQINQRRKRRRRYVTLTKSAVPAAEATLDRIFAKWRNLRGEYPRVSLARIRPIARNPSRIQAFRSCVSDSSSIAQRSSKRATGHVRRRNCERRCLITSTSAAGRLSYVRARNVGVFEAPREPPLFLKVSYKSASDDTHNCTVIAWNMRSCL